MSRAIGFDLGGTLIDYSGVPLSWECKYTTALTAIARLWRDDEIPESVLNAAIQVLRRFNTRLNPRVDEVDYTEVFGAVLKALGVPASEVQDLVEQATAAFFGVFRSDVRIVADARETVDRLKSSGPVGVLTDVPYGMPRRFVVSDLNAVGLGDLSGTTITSVDTGVRKPDPRGYAELALRLGCLAEEMLFVGDEEKDILGARRAGMIAALLWRSTSPAPSWGQHYTLASLRDFWSSMPASTSCFVPGLASGSSIPPVE